MLEESIKWYLLLGLLSVFSFPLVFTLFPTLRDRGYALARAFGLLVWGYSFWMLSSLGVLPNSLGGYLTAMLLVLALSVWAVKKEGLQTLRAWLNENLRLVLTVELLFVLCFFGFAWFRAISPEIFGTEKPMELAFINAILRSPQMPPNDPWLSGYAISYYYFGYLIVAMLSMVTQITAGAAFNLGVAMVFALVGIGSYSLLYNLLARHKGFAGKTQIRYYALLAPLFVLIVSNAEGFLETLHRRGYFWEPNSSGTLVSSFWQDTLDIKDLENPPNLSELSTPRHWWWWRASRVVRDYSYPILTDIRPDEVPDGLVYFNGDAVADQEVIDEFPFFSFWLADLHPHVLIMPFSFVAMSLALAMFFTNSTKRTAIFGFEYTFSPFSFWVAAFVFGGLAFLNMWDFPIYVGLFAMAYTLKRINTEGWAWRRLAEFLVLGVALGFCGAVLYLPFFIGFDSQAGGILPNLINPTRGWQLWTMFFPLLVPMFVYSVYRVLTRKNKLSWWAAPLAFVVPAGLFLFSLLLSLVAGAALLSYFSAESSLSELLKFSMERRVQAVGGLLSLVVLLGLAFASLWPRKDTALSDEKTVSSGNFVGVMIVLGVLLVMVPEFIYLRDNFGTRMNTIFKFYYQAWLLWAVAAAYASVIVLVKVRPRFFSWFYLPVFAFVLYVGLSYPVIGWRTRVLPFLQREEPILEIDGTANFWVLNNDDHQAVEWLLNAPMGPIIEAVGGQYSNYARISEHSGMPAVLGWAGHEAQWRGGYDEVANRAVDIGKIYSSASWAETKTLLQLYNVRYVYVGQLEQNTYAVYEGKFVEFLPVVYKNDSVTIYEYLPDPQ